MLANLTVVLGQEAIFQLNELFFLQIQLYAFAFRFLEYYLDNQLRSLNLGILHYFQVRRDLLIRCLFDMR